MIAPADRVEPVKRKPLSGEHDVSRDTAMVLAEDAAVALKPLGIIGPIIEDVVVERA